MSFPYLVERGERLRPEPMPLPAASPSTCSRRGEPLLINENLGAEAERYGSLRGGRRDAEVPSLGSARHRRARDRRHLARQLRPRARVRRSGRAAADDAGRQPERRARERAAGARDAAAERRAGADQQRAGGDRGRARRCRRSTTSVGDKIQEIFDAQVVDIAIRRRGDRATSRFPYIDRAGRAAAVRSRCCRPASPSTCSRPASRC